MNKQRFYTALFVLLLVFHGFALTIWIKQDKSVPGVDDSIHLSHSLMCHYLSQDLTMQNIARILTVSPYYPPFFPCSSTVLYRILDTSYASARFSNVIFLLLLLAAVFLLGAKLFSYQTAFFAALLVSFYPMTLTLSRFYYIDLSLCFFVTLALYALLLTKNFSNLSFSILFGLVCGFGMLTKWTFAFFLAVPVLYSLYSGCRKDPANKRHNVLHALISALLCLVVCSPWYIVNSLSLSRTLKQGFYLDVKHDPSPGDILFYIFYLKSLVYEQLRIEHFIISFISMVILVVRKKLNASEKFLLVYFLSAFVIFTAIHNKDVRFTAPLLPAVALLTAQGLSQLSICRKELIAGIIFVLVSIGSYAHFCPQPKNENWMVEDAAAFLTQSIRKPRKPVFVGIYAPHDKVHFYALQYFFLRDYFETYGAFPFVLRELNKPVSSGEDIFILKARKPHHIPGMKRKRSLLLPDNEFLSIYFTETLGVF